MDLYLDFINEVVKSLPKIDSKNTIMSVYLGGSVSRGDYVVGASDIDLYVVVVDEKDIVSINKHIQCIAKEKLFELLSWCPDGVTVTFTTYHEVKMGKSWLGSHSEYFSFQETGKLLYGKDIKKDIPQPNEEDISKMTEQVIEQLKQLMQQDISQVDKDKYFLRNVFGTVFSAMYFYLCRNKIYIRGKEKIILKFEELLPSCSDVAKEILHLWDVFGERKLEVNEIEKLIKHTRYIIDNI